MSDSIYYCIFGNYLKIISNSDIKNSNSLLYRISTERVTRIIGKYKTIMNELEKTVASEETVNSAPNMAETVKECVSEDACKVETSPAMDLESVADAQQDEAAESVKNVHSMTKEELLNALKEILDQDNMEAHKEVTALKQAFFNIKSKENLEEITAYVEAGNDPATFSSTPDEVENEFKNLFADFKEKRAAYLAADEKMRNENLVRKNEIISKMEEIASDIDNVNTKFADFQQLQQDFKSIKEVPASAETEIWKKFQNVVEKFYDNLKINKELRDFDFKKNLESKRALIEEARKLENMTDVVAASRALQALHDQWRAIGPVDKELREEIWEQFKEASTVVNKRHQEYFEQRKAAEQANEDAKTAICEEAEAIKPEDMKTFGDWNSATEKIIALQKKWKEYGYASKKVNTALYNRFRKVCDTFFEAKAAYFQQTRDEFSANLEKKTALCERAEALKDVEDVRKAADEAVKLQAEWKSVGSVPRKQSDAIWERFTTACNAVFERRNQQNKERHREENDNLDAKRAVIASLKELPLDGDRNEVITEVKQLQEKWNAIGFVPFKMKDKIYAEYREVVDSIYNAYKSRRADERMNNFRNNVAKMKGNDQKVEKERDRLARICESKRAELKTIENNMVFFSVKSSAGNTMVKELENRLNRMRADIKELEEKIAILDKEQA